jgi:hypothetical protein
MQSTRLIKVFETGLMVALLTGCALFRSSPSKQAVVSEHATEVPAWVYAPSEGCDEEAEMCASGEGPTGAVADANAMKSLAAIFETRIVATTQADAQMSQDQSWRSSREQATSSVREEVAQTLEAAAIKSRHRHKGLSYSLAALDKERAAGSLRTSMERTQAELQNLWKRRDRAGWARMWELALTRDALGDRLFLITGGKAPYDPSVLDLQHWYQSRKAERALGWSARGLSPELEGAVKTRLTEAGWVLTTGGPRAVSAVLEARETHLKVTGFQKWEFSLVLAHTGAEGAKKGVLNAMATATGRSRADCETKARAALLKMIDQELSKLNLED